MSPCLGVIFFPNADPAGITWKLSPSLALNVLLTILISPSISPQELRSTVGLRQTGTYQARCLLHMPWLGLPHPTDACVALGSVPKAQARLALSWWKMRREKKKRRKSRLRLHGP